MMSSQNIAHPTLIYQFNWSFNRPNLLKCTYVHRNVHRKMYIENVQFSFEAMFHLIVRSFIIRFLFGFQVNVQLTQLVWRGIITQNPTYGTFSYSGSQMISSAYKSSCPLSTRFGPVPVRVAVPPMLAAYAMLSRIPLPTLSNHLSSASISSSVASATFLHITKSTEVAVFFKITIVLVIIFQLKGRGG